MKKDRHRGKIKLFIKLLLANIGVTFTASGFMVLMVVCVILPLTIAPIAYFVVMQDKAKETEESCTCTFLTQAQIDALKKAETNGTSNNGSSTAGENTGDGTVNIPDKVLVSAEGLVIPNSKGDLLTGIENPYGFPLYTGYTESTPGSEVIVPFSTDNRVESKVAQAPSYTTYASDTMTIAERAKRNSVSTEFVRDKLHIEDNRLCVALGAGAIAWADDPDRSASMLNVDADIVFGNGTVLPVRLKDAKANKHTGNLHKLYSGGVGSAPDYSIIELHWGLKVNGQYVTQTWLSKFGRDAGGIDHIKVYNHKNVAYATSVGGYDASTIATNGNSSSNGNTSSNTNTESSIKLNYKDENLDGGEVKSEYTISSCDKLSVKSMSVSLTNGYPKDSATAKGLVIHFNAGPGSLSGMQDWFNGTDVASHFQIDKNGQIAQYLPFNKYAICSNSENGKRIGIEVANKSVKDAEYTEETYKSLVHLVAYLSYELGYSMDFNFVDNLAGNKYRDLGDVIRHYDTTKNGKQYAKACPAYWVPNDGSVSNKDDKEVQVYLQNAGAGGNTRWISFKKDVADYIAKYKNDANFSVKLEDGSDLLGLDWAKEHTEGRFDWKNVTQTASSGNKQGGSSTQHNYTTECHMKTDGYCGCYIRDPNCKCGCTEETENANASSNGSTGGSNSGNESGEVSYTDNKGLPIPATRQYTMQDVVSTGPQRVLDTAMVTFQAMYKAGSHNLDKVPLYTWNTRGLGYNYTGLAQVPYTTADGLKTAGKWDCSSYVCAVLNNMGISKYNQQSTGTMINMDLSEFGFTRLTFSKEALQPGDIVVKVGHTEIFAGWADDVHKTAYVWSWGSSERKSNYGDGKGIRGLPHANDAGVSGYPGAGNNGVDSLITGPKPVTQGNYSVIYRYTGK